jgi:hypothetical protein
VHISVTKLGFLHFRRNFIPADKNQLGKWNIFVDTAASAVVIRGGYRSLLTDKDTTIMNVNRAKAHVRYKRQQLEHLEGFRRRLRGTTKSARPPASSPFVQLALATY